MFPSLFRLRGRVVPLFASLALASAAVAPSVLAEETKSSPAVALRAEDPGYFAYQTMLYLSSDIGSRVAGSEAEARAADYIAQQFGSLGLTAEKQPFSYAPEDGGEPVRSANVVATLPGKSSRVLYVGAHYDSVRLGRGADDNASGIGVMLEAAKAVRQAKEQAPYTIKFIAFGAEEDGLAGSREYVAGMSPEEIDGAVAMINLDSLAVGDRMYVYGNHGTDGFVRELGLAIADRLKLNVGTQTGLHPVYPAGTTIDASDHVAFKYAGIPYGYLEATNWTLGAKDGYTQTEKDGEVWHTEKDTLDYVAANYPGRIEERLRTFTMLLTRMLLEIQEPPAGPAFRDQAAAPWAYDAIGALASMDIVLGDDRNDFHPLQPVTRAEAVAMTARAIGLYDPEAIVSFSDVSPEDWHYPYIASSVEWLLVQGVGGGKFDPDGAMTREQLAVLGANVIQAFPGDNVVDTDAVLKKYNDGAKIAGYARESVALLTGLGILQGTSGSAFAPREIVTRAQAAVMIRNLIGGGEE